MAVVAAPIADSAAAVAVPDEHPVAKIRRLADDLSVAMDDWPFGVKHWRAVVYPKATGGQPISFEQVGASPTDGCLALIDVHRGAMEALQACNPADAVWCQQNGVRHTKAADRRQAKASRQERRALMDLCSYRAQSPADRKLKASYLLAHVDRVGYADDMELRAVLRSMI